MDRVEEIYEVFKEYFGEDKVDLQDDRTNFDKKVILVWFPELTVTNEHDESTNITDLYIRVRINQEGLMEGVFDATRSSYLMSQVYADYLHSHALHIPRQNYEYSKMCLGSGPINGTCSILNAEYDLDRWRLFCFELDKYVTVESEVGIPYHHLNRISRSSWEVKKEELIYTHVYHYNNIFIPDYFKSFICQFVKKRLLKFVKESDHWFIAHSFLEYISILTTAFKEYIKDNQLNENDLFNKSILFKGTYKNGKFETKIPSNRGESFNPEGLIACTFKGENKIVTVTSDLVYGDDSKDIIINPNLANIALFKILNVLNYGTIKQREGSATEEDRIIII